MESIQTNQRHNHINSQFKHGNVDLGFRMLVDIVLDTNDASVYQYIIDLMHWQDANPNNEEAFSQKCIEILDKIGEFAIKDLSPDQTLLVANGLTKTYKGRRFSFGPIDMTIKVGDMIGLVGENGNGKTTLLRLLARDLQLTSGSIDYPYITDKSSLYDIRTQLIYIPQRTPTWYGAVKDNLKFAAAHYGVAPQDNEAFRVVEI
jgi:ABC-2 type transport system ATP-binding protein